MPDAGYGKKQQWIWHMQGRHGHPGKSVVDTRGYMCLAESIECNADGPTRTHTAFGSADGSDDNKLI